MDIHHIAISVSDLEKSVRFYKDMLGFQEAFRFTKKEWKGKAVVMKLNDIELEIFHLSGFVRNQDNMSDLNVIGIKHFAIAVKDIDKTYAELKSKGIDIDLPKKGTTCSKYCFLRDPDQIPIELYEK